MSSPLDHVPAGTRAKIEIGLVPPPRAGNDPPDPVRDAMYAIAVAEETAQETGDWSGWDWQQARYQELLREGHRTDWRPRPLRRITADARSGVDHQLVDQIRAAEESAQQSGDWSEWDRLQMQAMRQREGTVDEFPENRLEPQRQMTRSELLASIEHADAEGDHVTADQGRANLMLKLYAPDDHASSQEQP